MTQEASSESGVRPVEAITPRSSLRLIRRWALPASQALAVAVAAYLGWHGYRMVDEDRLAIDRAAGWYLVALLLLAYFAWDGRSRPNIIAWPRNIAVYVRSHPVEMVLLAGILAGGAFVRLYRFGTLPPNGYVIFEEHINGGIGFDILHGDRPYIYPIPRYLGALSLWIFGPSTTGLRAHSVAAGILAVPFFYLLMREIVERPAALFATAIYASLRVLGDVTVHYQTPTLAQIIMVWLMLRGVRTRNAVWFVPAAFLAAVLSYEYETSKAVPLFAAPFLVFIALRALAWPPPRSVEAAWQRFRALAPNAVKPLVVIVVTVLIGIGPMIAQAHRGQNIYFSSLDRQEADREARGTPGLFAPNAAKQVKWSVEVFTPWMKPGYHVLGSIATGGVIDRVTSILLWLSLAAGLLMFWRGSRALFVAWFCGGLLVSGLLLSNFDVWKVTGFLTPAVALIGLAADDVFRLLTRYGRVALWGASLEAAVIVAVIFLFNVQTLNANANDPYVLKEWSNTPSQLYSICDYLRGRPAENYALVAERARIGWGFSTPPKDANERRAAWGDFRFVCWDLQGQSAPNLEEAWPLYVDGSRPVSYVEVGRPEEVAQAVRALDRAMPELGQPELLKDAPAGLFETLAFNTTSDVVNARRGLVGRALASGSASGDERVVAAPDFDVQSIAAGGGFALSGLVYTPSAINASLVPLGTQPGDALEITVDGEQVYSSDPAVVSSQSLLPGWHLVDIRGQASEARLRFVWRERSGHETQLQADDFFALADQNVWKHVRTTQAKDGKSTTEWMRFDFEPHISAFDGLRVGPHESLPQGTTVLEETWTAHWTVENAGVYRANVFASDKETISLRIDGNEVTPSRPGVAAQVTAFTLAPGDHTVELTFSAPKDPNIGGVLTITDGTGHPVTMRVRPF